jgi:dTDP-4-amino-4,6-dideoxygalactose transaminase
VDEVFSSGRLYLGPHTRGLEEEWAAYCGASYGVACSSGTDALVLALQASDIGAGDEVITVSHTFIATVAAVVRVGATPVFVDIDPRTYAMDVSQLPSAVSTRTKAILPVHLYGHPADMAPILDLARQHGLAVIEDAAQAHGATYRGQRVGGIGTAGCFSFVFTKNMRAYGDAGMLVTNDFGVAEKARRLRDHGRCGRYEHVFYGWNARIDEVQAAILRLKLALLEGWIAGRRKHAGAYSAALPAAGLPAPYEAADVTHVYHQYVTQVDDREALREELAGLGIETGVHYPIPCHLQEACSGLDYGPGSLPETERAAGRVLSLPVYPELTEDQRAHVVRSLLEMPSRRIAEGQRV